jgi:EmrB/QacA subfamily drug resistance transporter
LPEHTDNFDRLDPGVWKAVSVSVLGSFLSQLDATVVNVSLGSLAVELHSSLQTIQWVTSGYLLALALMLPLNGWLVERIGTKRLYLICFCGFTLSSVLCALSWSADSLIGFRVLQGISGGLMAPLTQLMIARAAGKHMVRVMGYVAVPVLLGPIVGPVVAGAILQHESWRWLFLINLPIGVLAIVLASLFLPADNGTRSQRSFDLVGFLTLSPALVLFLYGSDHLNKREGMVTLLLSVVLLATFFRKALKDGPRGLIDLQLFRGEVFSASALTQFTVNGLSFAGQMLIPAYLFLDVGKSPSATGWLMAPMGLGMVCTYPWVGRLTQRLGIRGTSSTGALIAFLGTLPFFYLSSKHFSLAILAVALFIRGIGMSAVGVPSISAAYASVRKEELPMATTSLNIVQRLGGPTLTTVCATFLGWRLADVHSESMSSAFTMCFILLCSLHVLLILAARRLPRTLESVEHPPVLPAEKCTRCTVRARTAAKLGIPSSTFDHRNQSLENRQEAIQVPLKPLDSPHSP